MAIKTGKAHYLPKVQVSVLEQGKETEMMELHKCPICGGNALSGELCAKCRHSNKRRTGFDNRVKSMTGQRFGRLIVISEKPTRGPCNRFYYECKCDCGNTKLIEGSHLRTGAIQSCGCFRDEKTNFGMHLLPGEEASHAVMHTYKIRARKLNREFSLDEQVFYRLVQQPCFYCGKPPSTIQKSKNNNGDFIYNGLDRKDNSKGYIVDNVVPCCSNCNKSKGDKDFDEFIEFIKNKPKSHS